MLSSLLAIAGPSQAADLSLPVTGNLVGAVMDGEGTPQIGAVVQLLNRYERVVSKTLTSADGAFVFAGLPFDTYGVRVSQPSFLPAFRDRITVKPGVDSFLRIHLATLFSNIQVSYKLPSGAMSNDWKWALRTSMATRPVTRYLPELKPKQHAEAGQSRAQIFSDTHATLRLNGGDAGVVDTGMAVGDLGSIFAISTNLFGKNQLQLAGSLGQSSDLSQNVRGIAAVYQRDPDNPFVNAPEVTLTVSQFSRFGAPFGATGQLPGLRVMALNLYQVSDPLDNLHLEYGVSGQSVSYLQQATRISPFARATIAVGPDSEVVAAFSDGNRPDALITHSPHPLDEGASPADQLSDAVNALVRLPQMANNNNRLVLERTQSYEVGYRRREGGRTFALSAFREQTWNGQLNLSGNLSTVNSANVLFDGMSKTSTYDIGSYSRIGYVGSVTQRLTDNMNFGFALGRMGGFAVADSSHLLAGNQPLQMRLNDVAGANFRALIPASGTRITAGYGWIDSGSFVPVHVFVTQSNVVSPGLNFGFQQPLPALFGFPGHVELTADLRNLLAQGYIPIGPGAPGQLLVVQSPRAIRGGLSFTF